MPSDTAYSETCAAIGLAFFARRMLQISPKSEYADVMESALYNTVLAGMALDGKSFFYVNPLEVVPKATIAADHVSGTLAFRIPGWSRTTKFVVETANGVEEIVVNGQTCSKDAIADGKIKVSCEQGYLYLTGEWSEETISMEFDLQVRLVKANTNVREAVGMVAVVRGPITYCIEEVDNGANLHLIRIDLDAYKNTGATLDITEELGHAITTITLPGKRGVESNLMPLYMEETEAEEQSVAIRMVPYYAWNNRGEGEMRMWIRK